MNRVEHGDCFEVMKKLPNDWATAIVTDPPYALQFMGKGWDKVLPPGEVWNECLRVLKPGGMMLAFGGTRTFHRLTCAIEDAGFQIRDILCWLHAQGFPKSYDIGKRMEGWDGYGSNLKPAYEPIVCAQKSLDGTFVANALKHGVAGINIDATRIEGEPVPINKLENWSGFGQEKCPDYTPTVNTKGRWPANVVLDEEAGKLLDEQSGILKSGKLSPDNNMKPSTGWESGSRADRVKSVFEPNSGGASRFYYCAKAGKKERGEGNIHNTVKPISLMRWLVRMVKMPTRTLIVDPFTGSGSTGIACVMEGVDFLGIEREADYVEIARRRIKESDES